MRLRRPRSGQIYGVFVSAVFHLTVAATLVLMTSNQAQDSAGVMQLTMVVAVPPPVEPVASPDDRVLDADSPDLKEAIDDVGGLAGVVGGLDFDLGKIQARRDGLFPFLTTSMGFLDGMREESPGKGSALVAPLAAERTSTRLPPLRLTDTERQRTIDQAWSRRARWSAFAGIASLLRSHDADTGDVPTLLRAYLDQNLLQLFCDTDTRARRFWAMLENAADHIEFIEFIRVFVQDHSASLATTELLFLLDKLAQASRDTLLLLNDIDPERELTLHPSNGSGVELGRALQMHYRERLVRGGLSSPDDIKAWYQMLRLRILSTVVASSPGGYRVADARFLAGAIHFERGDVEEAMAWWQEIRPDPRDSYAEDYSRLLGELQRPEGAEVRQIKHVLDSVSSRWRTSSLERLRHFGRTCESYF